MCEPMVDQRDYLKSPLQTPSCLWAGAEHRFPLIKGQRKGNKGRVHSRVQVPPGVIPSPGSWSDPSSAQCSQRARTALAWSRTAGHSAHVCLDPRALVEITAEMTSVQMREH